MKPQVACVLLLGLLLVGGALDCSPREPTSEAVAELEKLGGTVETANGKVVSVGFAGRRVTDADLEHLKGLTNLESLHLGSTQVTDAGAAELQRALPDCRIIH